MPLKDHDLKSRYIRGTPLPELPIETTAGIPEVVFWYRFLFRLMSGYFIGPFAFWFRPCISFKFKIFVLF